MKNTLTKPGEDSFNSKFSILVININLKNEFECNFDSKFLRLLLTCNGKSKKWLPDGEKMAKKWL